MDTAKIYITDQKLVRVLTTQQLLKIFPKFNYFELVKKRETKYTSLNTEQGL